MFGAAGAVWLAAGQPPAAQPQSPPEPVGLPNLHSLGGGLWSGGTPDGDEGFRSLRDLGIKTVVSVDGIRPDIERAHRFGLTYIHIPIGYGGISLPDRFRLGELARTRTEPIYVHCHHGQHRGPTAAALMRRCQGGGWTAEEAVAFLKVAGTDPKYEGLYASVSGRLPTLAHGYGLSRPTEIGKSTCPEVADVGGLTARMVEVDDLWDAIKKAKENGWQPVAGSSNSVARLAVQLNEQFREAARLPDAPSRPESFRKLLSDAEQAAANLEKALRSGDAESATKAFDRTAATCSACHREHRDHKRP